MMRRIAGLVIAFALSLPVAGPLAAAEMGDDGLHKTAWMRDTFRDLSEDLEEANAEGKRLLLLVEQRGCIYCDKMHKEVFSQAEVSDYIEENFFVVQINLYGDTEVTDFDGETASEKNMARRWGLMFTPTMMFLPESVAQGQTASEAAVATMPGAFGKGTTLDMLTWVNERLYDVSPDEGFQRYHARRIQERADGAGD